MSNKSLPEEEKKILKEPVQEYISIEKTVNSKDFDMENIIKDIYDVNIEMLESETDTTPQFYRYEVIIR